MLINDTGGATVFDDGLQRLTHFDSEGRLVRTQQIPTTAALEADAQILWQSGDTLVIWEEERPGPGVAQIGLITASGRLVTVDLARGHKQTLATLPSTQHFVYRDERASSRFTTPFGTRSFAVAADRGAALTINSGEGVLRRHLPDGTVAEIAPLKLSRRRVTPSDRANALEEARSGFFEEAVRMRYGPAIMDFLNQRWRSIAVRMPIGDTYPLFDQVTIGPAGELWLLDTAPPLAPPERWTVVSIATGQVVRQLRVLHRGRVIAATFAQGVLVTIEESFDKEHFWIISYRAAN